MSDGQADPDDLYIIDSCVILDYLETGNEFVLRRFSNRLGRLHIHSDIRDREVTSLCGWDWRFLEIDVLAGATEQWIEATRRAKQSAPRGPSRSDFLSLILARDSKLTLITNDKILWKHAEQEGVRYIRGLRLMSQLRWSGHLPISTASKIARQICENDRRYITRDVLEEFEMRIGAKGRRIILNDEDRKTKNESPSD